MTALEINQHFNGLIDGLREDTVDRIIYGNPQSEVTGIAVAWMPYLETIKEAGRLGANLLVTHEPTFYDHLDLEGKGPSFPATDGKMRLIDKLGLTIIRCHDVWDALPDIGIPFAWGDFLDLGDPVGGKLFYNLYSVAAQSSMAFAADVARKTAALGQPTIGFYGDPNKQIRTVGLGTGCISNPFDLYELGADLAISVDDVVRAWIAGEWCRDQGNPLLVVNHCVSEEPGMATLAAYLDKTYPEIPVAHIHQECTYLSVTG